MIASRENEPEKRQLKRFCINDVACGCDVFVGKNADVFNVHKRYCTFLIIAIFFPQRESFDRSESAC